MHDELTQVDIDKMKEELTHRIQVLRPQLIEEVKVARSFGDLSENFEYKAAKREKNRNDSRIRYLENMIRTAKVIEPTRPIPSPRRPRAPGSRSSTRSPSARRTTTRRRRSSSSPPCGRTPCAA